MIKFYKTNVAYQYTQDRFGFDDYSRTFYILARSEEEAHRSVFRRHHGSQVTRIGSITTELLDINTLLNAGCHPLILESTAVD